MWLDGKNYRIASFDKLSSNNLNKILVVYMILFIDITSLKLMSPRQNTHLLHWHKKNKAGLGNITLTLRESAPDKRGFQLLDSEKGWSSSKLVMEWDSHDLGFNSLLLTLLNFFSLFFGSLL